MVGLRRLDPPYKNNKRTRTAHVMSRFFDLSDRVALVTGAGRGIGEGIARRLAAAGAMVVVFDANADDGRDLAAEIDSLAIVGDVCSEPDVVQAVSTIEGRYGRLDILVNNAGIT